MTNVRVPPQSLDAERSVLGSIMLLNGAIEEVAAIVSAESFYSNAHASLFAVMLDMKKRRLQIDGVTLAEELIRINELEEVGGAAYIGEVLDSVPHAQHALHYSRIVREKYNQRKLIYGINDLSASLYDGMSPDDAVAALDALSQSVGTGLVGDTTVPLTTAIDELEKYEALVEAGKIKVLTTTIKPVDDAHELGGMPGAWMAILAARTSIGKTALATQIACDNAAKGVPGVIYSLEMKQRRVASRIVRSMERSAARDLPLMINDKVRDLRHILMDIRMQVRKRGVRLVVVDYLQLVRPPDRRMDRNLQVMEISRSFLEIANELDITILGVSQLTRGSEDRIPKINDLSESGALENDADSVMLLHRERGKSGAQLILAKNREGGIGKFDLEFKAAMSRIEARDEFRELAESMP